MKLPTDFVLLQRSDLAALRSENTRLTEQVRGAEGVVEAARDLRLAMRVWESNGMEDEAFDGTLAAWNKSQAELDAALSIYDEGAGGRSESASPQSGDGVSGYDGADLTDERSAE